MIRRVIADVVLWIVAGLTMLTFIAGAAWLDRWLQDTFGAPTWTGLVVGLGIGLAIVILLLAGYRMGYAVGRLDGETGHDEPWGFGGGKS